MKIVKMNNINKSFKENQVLQNFSMNVEENTFTVISGRSGCGKSTLLNIIGLLEKVDSGEIELFGYKNIKPYSPRAHKLLRDKIGYLFQNFALIDNESVEYNLKIALEEVKNIDKLKTMIDVLTKVGLDKEFLKKKVYQCSGGEQQRIAIARLFLKPCELILADEPTGSLDPDNKTMIIDLLRLLQKEGKTIIVVTHEENFFKIGDCHIELKKIIK